jgi:prophage tail gpP-like protein
MSKSYTVKQGDTLAAISSNQLGTAAKWKEIVNSNPQLSSRKTAVDGSPYIFSGDVLVIPTDESAEKSYAAQPKKTIKLTNGDDDISIIIGGNKFTGFTSYEFNLSYDSFDTFSFSAPYDTKIEGIHEAIQPFAFKSCDIVYADTPLFRGRLLTPDPALTNEASEITLRGYPLCGVLNDCMLPPGKYPLPVQRVNIQAIAEAACEPYGIPVIFETDPGADFTEVSLEPTDKILDFLLKLSQQRELLFTNNEKGQLVFFKPKTTKPFVVFEEGKRPLISVKAKFNAQEFYSHITGYNKTDAEYPTLSYTFENSYLISKGILRHKSIIIDDAETSSDVQTAVKAHAGRMFADSVAFEIECEGHTNKDGELFQKGMNVNVKAPGAMIVKEMNFTARNIKFKRTNEGKTAVISLVLPGSYTGDIPEALPWE